MPQSNPGQFCIFTHGRYKAADLPFYRKLTRGRTTIAVDGGSRLFIRAALTPDVLMGDFDSLQRVPKRFRERTDMHTFPARKDKTDLQLAVEFCLRRQARSIDIVMPDCGQPDHFLGNIMLVHLVDRLSRRRGLPTVRFVNPDYEIRLIRNGPATFEKCRGHTVSVIPLTRQIVLTCRGTEYDVHRVVVPRGDTRSMRNRTVSDRARFMISRGAALVVRVASG